MRFFLAILAALAVVNAKQVLRFQDIRTPADVRSFEDTVETAIECVRDIMEIGAPDFEIPPLEPLIISELAIDLGLLGNPDITGSGKVTNLKAVGITHFKFPSLEGTVGIFPPGFELKFTVNSEKVVFSSEYEFDITFKGKRFFGKGTIDAEHTNLATTGIVHLKLVPPTVDQFEIYPKLDSIKFTITGAMDDEAFSAYISDYITKQLPNLIQEHQATITELAEKYVLEVLTKCRDGVSDTDPLKLVCNIIKFGREKCLPIK